MIIVIGSFMLGMGKVNSLRMVPIIPSKVCITYVSSLASKHQDLKCRSLQFHIIKLTYHDQI